MLHGYTPPTRFLPYLSWTEIDALPDRENTVIVLPAGAIEQHGPHLPCAVDSIVAAGVVGHAMAKLPADVPAYALPPITYGKSDEHLHFPGTVTLTGEVLLHTAIEIGESVYRAGFRKLVIVNAHGGQPQPLEMAARELRLRHGDFVIIARSAWSVPHDGSFFSEDERKLSMHAGHGETAILMALAPDTVHMERAEANMPAPFPCPTLSSTRPAAAWCARDFGPNGVIGDPRGATPAQGEQLLDQLSTQWANAIGEVHRMNWPVREVATWGRGHYTGHIESRR
ncbi:creatininase family protein [Pararobbsia silviterrae]|uniref:Creatininase family protein n=1 Tax=Pararobbsia silviterrae TaxID=1792498 RepID=A0A494Y4M0_9BURK|nr:creatininase family protein [Pararobbsia silviterrae]RKP57628.1 creatininase family protein [Pararobbsia silviterrae]